MNKFKTKNYYRELNKDSLCSCDYCRNYYKRSKQHIRNYQIIWQEWEST